ncbi:MAG TPA: hypothetical protein VLE70_06635 [Anaerolineae bacterium]|nr:hypothetical protein [Anaerolineae bacterium]
MSQEEQQPLEIGSPAADFSLLNTNGNPYTLSAALAKQPLVVVFYRGDW